MLLGEPLDGAGKTRASRRSQGSLPQHVSGPSDD
jgi:hypothetical protein